jgi:propanediol dehydratase large subunit
MARKVGRSPRGLAGVTRQMLEAELRRRERSVRTLERKRDRHLGLAEQLDERIRQLGGSSGSGGRIRPRNEMNLVEALAKVLDGKTMSVTDVAEAVQRAGYRTSSDNFRTIVNQTLIKSDRFKKVSRGQYTAK